MNNPCKPDCKKRSGVCHATCKDYKDFREELNLKNEKIKKENMLKKSLDDYEFENHKKRC